jgi:hypothetical protein
MSGSLSKIVFRIEALLTFFFVFCNLSEYLYFSKTSFSGHLPKFPTGLVELDVSFTLIDGGLEGSNFEGLNSLEWLVLDGNQFDAPIPAEIGALESLEYFYAAGAMITGDLSYMENMPSIFEHWVDDNPGLVSIVVTRARKSDILGYLSVSNLVHTLFFLTADWTNW